MCLVKEKIKLNGITSIFLNLPFAALLFVAPCFNAFAIKILYAPSATIALKGPGVNPACDWWFIIGLIVVSTRQRFICVNYAACATD